MCVCVISRNERIEHVETVSAAARNARTENRAVILLLLLC